MTIQVPLPPLEEQRRIVAQIEELAAKIEEARGLRRETIQESVSLLRSARRKIIGDKPDGNWLPLSTCVEEIENGKSLARESRPAQKNEWGVLKVADLIGFVGQHLWPPSEAAISKLCNQFS